MKHVSGHALSAFIFSFLLIGCGRLDSRTSGAGGNPGSVEVTNEYAWAVKINLPAGGGLCSGSIISRRAVLTASHCLDASGTYRIQAQSGSKMTSNLVRFGSGEVNDPNDIGILYWTSDVWSDDEVVELGTSAKVGDAVRIVGAGCDDLVRRTGAGVFRTTTNTISSINTHIELETPTAALSGAQGTVRGIIAGGTCFGDSGGPTVLEEGGTFKQIAATHAGGASGGVQYSILVNLTREDNRGFIVDKNASLNLGISL